MFRFLLMLFSLKKRYSLENKQFKIIFLFLVLFWYSSAGFLYFELPGKPDLNWYDAIWWTIVTMATVGYGDIFPATFGGRFFVGIPVILFGVGILTFLVSQIAMKMIESQSRRFRGMAEIKMKGHILIINYSNHDEILNLIVELKNDPLTRKRDICLIDDSLEEIPSKFLEYNVGYVRGNPSNEAILDQANYMRAASAIIVSKDRSNQHSDDRNLAIAVVLEKTCPSLFTIAEIIDPQKSTLFEHAGCDSVICTTGLSAHFAIKEMLDPGMNNLFYELWSNTYGKELYFVPLKFRDGVSYRDLVLWGLDSNCSIIGLKRNGKILLHCITEHIMEGDRAIVISDDRIAEIDIRR